MMLDGLSHLINSQHDMEVGWKATNPAEAFAHLQQAHPDLVLTDLTMPGRSGCEFVRDLLAFDPHLTILVVSMHDETLYAERLLRAGAKGYIMKDAGGENLLVAIRQVIGGSVYLSPAMSSLVINKVASPARRGSDSPIKQLTDREFEIFQLIGHGKDTHEIASLLHISPKTVDVHRSHIREKLQIEGVTALTRHAVRWIECNGSFC
jgi:DNA-binding NarL/FixJ family response regulator